jgi:hypothetical protein
MDKRFKVLRLIGSIYKVLGVITAVLTLIAAVGLCVASVAGGAAMEDLSQQLGTQTGLGGVGGLVGGLFLSLGAILWGGAMAAGTYAIGEVIYLLLATEENTRATALLLESQKNNQA